MGASHRGLVQAALGAEGAWIAARIARMAASAAAAGTLAKTPARDTQSSDKGPPDCSPDEDVREEPKWKRPHRHKHRLPEDRTDAQIPTELWRRIAPPARAREKPRLTCEGAKRPAKQMGVDLRVFLPLRAVWCEDTSARDGADVARGRDRPQRGVGPPTKVLERREGERRPPCLRASRRNGRRAGPEPPQRAPAMRSSRCSIARAPGPRRNAARAPLVRATPDCRRPKAARAVQAMRSR